MYSYLQFEEFGDILITSQLKPYSYDYFFLSAFSPFPNLNSPPLRVLSSSGHIFHS